MLLTQEHECIKTLITCHSFCSYLATFQTKRDPKREELTIVGTIRKFPREPITPRTQAENGLGICGSYIFTMDEQLGISPSISLISSELVIVSHAQQLPGPVMHCTINVVSRA